MNHITIELCAEDRARLDRIIAALEKSHPFLTKDLNVPKQGESAPQEAQEPAPRATTQPEPQKAPEPKNEPQEVQEPAPAEPKAEKAPEVSLEKLQELVVHLVQNGKKAEARELVLEYANSVTAVPAEKRGELFEKLQKLEG